MGIFKRLGKFSLISAGAAFVAPRLFSDGLDGLRPLAKEVIKGGMAAYDGISETVTEVGRQVKELVVEVKKESENGTSGKSHGKGTKENSSTRKTRGRKSRNT